MANILEEIVAHKRLEVERFKRELSEADIHAQVEAMLGTAPLSMKAALQQSGTGIIAEMKRKSPSKGWINEHCDTRQIPFDYQEAGAAAISILTDEKFFGGSHDFMAAAASRHIQTPMLYKNFVIDEYQIFQARRSGASAVLLIAACLSKDECRTLLRTAHDLQLEVLLEMHSEAETAYAELEPDMCGINNRNLDTFVVDTKTSALLAERLPQEAVKVSESGLSDPQTVRDLRAVGFCGFLIGETFMKTANPGLALKQFINDIESK